MQLTITPINLFFHFTIALSLAIILSLALMHVTRRRPILAHWVLVSAVLLLLRILLLILETLIWQGFALQSFLPALERFTSLLSILFLIAIFLFREKRWFRALLFGITMLGLIGLTLTLLAVPTVAYSNPFNSTWLDGFWSITSLAFSLLLLLYVTFSRPRLWLFLLLPIAIYTTGAASHLAWGPRAASIAIHIRLAETFVYPLFAILAAKDISETITQRLRTIRLEKDFPLADIIEAIISVTLAEETPFETESLTKMSKLLSQTFDVELCMLLTPPDETGHILVTTGYDQHHQDTIPQHSFLSSEFPTLTQAFSSSELVILPQLANLPERMILQHYFKKPTDGSLLFSTLKYGQYSYGALIMISCSSHRHWTDQEKSVFEIISDSIARKLHNVTDQSNSLASARAELESYQELNREHTELQQSLTELQQETQTINQQRDVLLKRYQQKISRIEELEKELSRLKQVAQSQTTSHEEQISNLEMQFTTAEAENQKNQEKLSSELRMVLEELSAARATIEDEQKKQQVHNLEQQILYYTKLISDMKRISTSIQGYTDLLMAESVGLLGAMQRKFVERVRHSISEMASLLTALPDEATEYSTATTSQIHSIDIRKLITEFQDIIAPQITAKNLSLKLDFSPDLPEITGTAAKIQAIFLALLQHAIQQSTEQDVLTIKAHAQPEGAEQKVLICFIDQGNGYSTEQLAQLFTPGQAHPANELHNIAFDLAEVKRLVTEEAGQIWANSEISKGSQISLLLPAQIN